MYSNPHRIFSEIPVALEGLEIKEEFLPFGVSLVSGWYEIMNNNRRKQEINAVFQTSSQVLFELSYGFTPAIFKSHILFDLPARGIPSWYQATNESFHYFHVSTYDCVFKASVVSHIKTEPKLYLTCNIAVYEKKADSNTPDPKAMEKT